MSVHYLGMSTVERLRERWGPGAEDKDEDRGARCLERGSTDARVKSSFVNLTMHFFSLPYYYYLLYQDELYYCTVC